MAAFACNTQKSLKMIGTDAHPIGAGAEIKAPLGLPPLQTPSGNPPTIDSIELGRKLFYEPKLSVDNTLSCASCHNPSLFFADSRSTSIGFNGQAGARNSPTVLNSAFNIAQFWDGRARSLEAQAAGPIADPKEMNQPHDLCAAKLDSDPIYKEAFAKVFGPGPITIEKITNALAAFERTLLSANSPFDRYQYGGDKSALSPAAVRGLAIFADKDRGNCSTCHVIGQTYALFTDDKFHNLGAGMNSSGELTDLGRFAHTGVESDRGAFRTPSLRNVARTAPYMHDGSLKTLTEVIDFYVGGGNSNPHLDKEIKPIKLSAQDRADLVAFLESLTGEIPVNSGPPTKD